MVPTYVAVAGSGGGAHVCCSGIGSRWWWWPRVWQWQAVLVVHTCVAVEGGVVVVPTCVVVEVSGSDAHVWQWKAVWW